MRHLLHALGRSSLGSPNVIRVPHLQSLLTRSTIVGVRQPLHALGRSSSGSPNLTRLPHLRNLLTRSTIVGVRHLLHALGRSLRRSGRRSCFLGGDPDGDAASNADKSPAAFSTFWSPLLLPIILTVCRCVNKTCTTQRGPPPPWPASQ